MPQQDDDRVPGPSSPGTPADDQSRPQPPAANPTQPMAGSPASPPVPGDAQQSDAPQPPGAQYPDGAEGSYPPPGWGTPQGYGPPQGYGTPQGYGPPQGFPGQQYGGQQWAGGQQYAGRQYAGQPLNAGNPAESGPWGAPAGVAQTAGGTRRPTAMWKKVAGGVALAAVVAVGGVAAVNAANASNTSSGQAGPGAMTSGAGGYGQGFGPGSSGTDTGRRGGIGSLGAALHGEFVVSTDSGGTETRRLQRGTVTAVGNGSLSVTSTDNFAATYSVGSGVDVSDIAVDDTVTVIATVDGTTVTAVSVTEGAGFGGMPPGALGGTDQDSDQGQTGGPGGTPPNGTAPQQGTAPTTQAPQTS